MNERKRSHFFRYIRSLQSTIICLQETHCPTDQIDRFHLQSLASQSYWTRQIALISFQPSISINNPRYLNDRAILVDVDSTIPDLWPIQSFSILAIYAPSSLSDRRRFFQDIMQHIRQIHISKPIIILGDFNFDFNRPEARAPIIQELLTYAHLLPSDQTTFHSGHHHSRIDHILLTSVKWDEQCSPFG